MRVQYTLDAKPEDIEILKQSTKNAGDYFLTVKDVVVDREIDTLLIVLELHPDEKLGPNDSVQD